MKKTITPCFSLKEKNSIWRNALHLGIRQKVSKGFLWCFDSTTFSFLDKGTVRLEGASSSGKQRIAFYIESGCLFRETNSSSSNTAQGVGYFIAMEDCVVYQFPIALFEDLNFIRENPDLVANCLTTLKQKSSILFFSLVSNNENISDGVVGRYLLSLAEKHGADTFRPDISQSELASIMGLHRSTVCRVIKTLRKEGILGSFTRYQLEILDRKKLQEYVTRFDLMA